VFWSTKSGCLVFLSRIIISCCNYLVEYSLDPHPGLSVLCIVVSKWLLLPLVRTVISNWRPSLPTSQKRIEAEIAWAKNRIVLVRAKMPFLDIMSISSTLWDTLKASSNGAAREAMILKKQSRYTLCSMLSRSCVQSHSSLLPLYAVVSVACLFCIDFFLICSCHLPYLHFHFHLCFLALCLVRMRAVGVSAWCEEFILALIYLFILFVLRYSTPIISASLVSCVFSELPVVLIV